MSDLPAQQTPAAPPAQPAAPTAQAPAAQVQSQPSVHVHLPPDLMRMAGLSQPAQAALPLNVDAPKVDAPAKPAEATPAPAAKPDAKADDTAALAQRLADLEAKHRSTLIRAEVDRIAAVAGAIDPAVVHALISADLDVADDGKVIVKGDARTTGEQHIARFLASKPYLLKPIVPGGGAGTPATLNAPGAAPVLSMSTNAGATALATNFAVSRGFLPRTS